MRRGSLRRLTQTLLDSTPQCAMWHGGGYDEMAEHMVQSSEKISAGEDGVFQTGTDQVSSLDPTILAYFGVESVLDNSAVSTTG